MRDPGYQDRARSGPVHLRRGRRQRRAGRGHPVRTCSSCGRYTDDEAEDIRHDEVCRHLGVLTATEIRDLRAKYDLSRAELARISGLGESSIGRWETREIIQNVANDRYLRLLRDPAIFLRAKSLASPEPVHAEPGELSPDLEDRLRDSGLNFTLQPAAA